MTDAALRPDKLDLMRLWVSRNSEVSVREQLSTQIVLAISSKVLEPGEKLPSTRSLARRLGIHANTVSAAFRDLARRGWVEVQKGRGVFVRAFEEETPLEGDLELDRLVCQFIERAREEGFSLLEIRSKVAHWLESHPPDHYLLIEADLELRRILQHEISSKTGVRVEAIGLDDCRDPSALVGAAVVALRQGRGHSPAYGSGLVPCRTSCRSHFGRFRRESISPSFRGGRTSSVGRGRSCSPPVWIRTSSAFTTLVERGGRKFLASPRSSSPIRCSRRS